MWRKWKTLKEYFKWLNAVTCMHLKEANFLSSDIDVCPILFSERGLSTVNKWVHFLLCFLLSFLNIKVNEGVFQKQNMFVYGTLLEKTETLKVVKY